MENLPEINIPRLEESKEIRMNRDDTKRQIRKWYEYFFACSCFLLIIHITLQAYLHFIAFAFLIAYEIRQIIEHSWLFLSTRDPNRKKYYCTELMISSSMLISQIILLLYVMDINPYLMFSGVPILILNTGLFFHKTIGTSKCLAISFKIETGYRWCLGAALLFAGLKDKNLISWNWFLVFWPVWIVILGLAMFGISEIIYTGKIIYRVINNRGQCVESICSMWLVYFSLGTAMALGYLFVEASLVMDSDQSIESRRISDAILIVILYFFGLFLLTVLFHRLLEYILYREWFEKYFYEGPVGANDRVMTLPPAPRISLPPVFINVAEYPKKMTRVSATFFTQELAVNQAVENEEEVNFSGIRLDESMENGKTCNICCARDSDTIIMKCGHSGVCFACACELWKDFKKCHICREGIQMIMQFTAVNPKSVEIIKAIKLDFA